MSRAKEAMKESIKTAKEQQGCKTAAEAMKGRKKL
jgi:hypothetical protein